MERELRENIEEIVDLYFKGYTVGQALKIVRKENECGEELVSAIHCDSARV